MRLAYGLLGIVWVLVLGAFAFNFNQGFSNMTHTNGPARDLLPAATTTMPSTFSLTSSAFTDGESIPSRYTCEATPFSSPPFSISNIPNQAKSLVLIMVDPDVPQKFKDQMHSEEFVHWVLFNIPSDTTHIAEGKSVGEVGKNGADKNAYAAPCPPKEYEPSEHRYIFKLYALDAMLDIPSSSTRGDVENAMKGHILGETQLIGLYKKH